MDNESIAKCGAFLGAGNLTAKPKDAINHDKRQVLLFTHHRRVVEIAGETLGPTDYALHSLSANKVN